MSVAVVGALWHTPVDVVGALLLSVGLVAGGAAVLEPILPQEPVNGTSTTFRSLARRARTTRELTAKTR